MKFVALFMILSIFALIATARGSAFQFFFIILNLADRFLFQYIAESIMRDKRQGFFNPFFGPRLRPFGSFGSFGSMDANINNNNVGGVGANINNNNVKR
jgi:hypothetical protein